MESLIFTLCISFIIVQRLVELRISNRNTKALLSKGAIEHGRSHYPLIVAMHILFFVSLLLEAISRGLHMSNFSFFWFSLFAFAQAGRVWVFKTLKSRWTTRVISMPGETLIRTGPYQYLSHPNYVVVAVELLSFPLIFGLKYTALLFTLLNAFLLLGIRIPIESKALHD